MEGKRKERELMGKKGRQRRKRKNIKDRKGRVNNER